MLEQQEINISDLLQKIAPKESRLSHFLASFGDSGATDGMGRVVAPRLAKVGYFVVVHGRGEARGRAVVDEITEAGGEVRFMACNLGSVDDVKRFTGDLNAEFGHIDVLINNVDALRSSVQAPVKFGLSGSGWGAAEDGSGKKTEPSEGGQRVKEEVSHQNERLSETTASLVPRLDHILQPFVYQ